MQLRGKLPSGAQGDQTNTKYVESRIETTIKTRTMNR